MGKPLEVFRNFSSFYVVFCMVKPLGGYCFPFHFHMVKRCEISTLLFFRFCSV